MQQAKYVWKMFYVGFTELVKLRATMPEDDPDVFDLFFQLLYTGRLNNQEKKLGICCIIWFVTSTILSTSEWIITRSKLSHFASGA
jgi:hypothetical protein